MISKFDYPGVSMRQMFFACLAGALVTACSGVGIIASDNPEVKISQADAMAKQGRSAQAQRLLKEAMAIYQERGNDVGLAEAHRQFAFLAREGQATEGLILVKNARSVTPTREDWELSQTHLRQALELFSRGERLDMVANTYFLLGIGNFNLNLQDQACSDLDRSLAANQQWETAHPGGKVELPRGIETYGALIAKAKQEMGCGA